MTPPLPSPTPHRSPQQRVRSTCPPLRPPPPSAAKWLPGEKDTITQPAPPPPTPLNNAGGGYAAGRAPPAASQPQPQALQLPSPLAPPPPPPPPDGTAWPAGNRQPLKELDPAKVMPAPAPAPQAERSQPQQQQAVPKVETPVGTPTAQESPKVTLDDIASLRSRLTLGSAYGCVSSL
jgi:neural Wiskott-Aldrich syndrome protein